MTEGSTIHVIAMSRTGHHAVIDWVEREYGEPANNLESQTFEESMSFPGRHVLVLRDYPNWLASVIRNFKSFDRLAERRLLWVDNWMSHVRAAFTIPTILYPAWHAAGHGKDIQPRVGMRFGDPDPLGRAGIMQNHPTFKKMMESRPDAVALSKSIDWLATAHAVAEPA